VNQDTYVIVPVYNEAPIVKRVIEELQVYFSNIICVDDGSDDATVKEIAQTKATLVRHSKNFGQGAALRTGMRHALRDPDAKYFITFDADGQHAVYDAVRLVQYLREEQKDVVLGSRFLGEAENMSWSKRLLLKWAIIFTNKTAGVKLTDAHNGLRAFNRRFAYRVADLRCNGMAHASEIIYRLAGGYDYAELPVSIRYTDYSKSKGQSMWNTFHIMRELLAQRAYESRNE
jgi:glycosyltransferase involved in cell wall biosynthesis